MSMLPCAAVTSIMNIDRPERGAVLSAGNDVTEEMFSGSRSPAQNAAFSVRVVEGPNVGKEASVDSSSGSILVGTSEACQLVLQDRRVSRRHLALELAGSMLRVTDLDSTNGTILNGTVIREAFAKAGDVLRIGETLFSVTAAAAAIESRLAPAASFGRIVGSSAAMRRLYPSFARLASSDVAVLIEGESGTGKELLAEVLHEQGPRQTGPFVVIDASAVPPQTLKESLFGGREAGAIQRAAGGTLLIDHVGALPNELQAQLAPEIDRTPSGGPRIIATSRVDLDKEVETGRFRQDLFFRIVVGRVELPALRRRSSDIRLLAEFFWKKLDVLGRSLPEDLLRRYEGYAWPGNVRELQSAVARRIALGDGDEDEENAPSSAPEDAFQWLLAQRMPFPMARRFLIDEFERAFMEKVLAEHGGNISRAAAASGLARRYFQLMRAKHRG